MKRLTSIGVLDDRIVHPQEMQKKLFDLRCKAELKVLEHKKNFVHVNCPACMSARHDNAFMKRNFTFRECNDCRTIFMSPRPVNIFLCHYYNDSEYAQYIHSKEYVDALFLHKEEEAQKRADRLSVLNQKVADTKNNFLLYAPKNRLLPNILNDMGFATVSTLSAPWEQGNDETGSITSDIISAFDIIERLPDPIEEISKLMSKLRKGGMIMFILRSGSGFDFLSLWQHSDIQPIEHMNLLTVEGAKILLVKYGLEIQEISTPGGLDLQFVERIKKEQNIRINRFIDYLLEYRDDFAKIEFQQFLQRGLLSSHLVMVGQKI